jgi:hypothetical protein
MSFVFSKRKPIQRRTAMLLLIVGACSSIVDPGLDPRAVPFQPPPVYARWWSMVESCSGLHGSLSEVSWYQVPGSETVAYSGDEVAGYWAHNTNRIVLGGEAALDGSVVRHEMLHALVRQPKGHPRQYFLDRCAGLVVCSSNCLADAGPAPAIDASVPRVSSEVLKLFVSVEPDHPSTAIEGGVFQVVVSATNPNPYAIVVTPSPGAQNHTFFYTFTGPSGGITGSVVALDASLTYYAAGETKRQYFDLSIATTLGSRKLPAGSYQLYAGYETRGVTLEGTVIGP